MLKRLPLLIAVLALAGWAGNFTIKNFLAVSLIAYGQPGESSDAAVGYAPANAEVLAARARYLLYRADPPRTDEAIADLQKTTTVSPRDYRYWLELGKAYNANGQAQQAEASLQNAVELAPKYFEPRWALANLQLRAGQVEQSVAQFRAAISLSGGGYGEVSPRLNRNVTLNAFNAVTGAVGMNLDVLRRTTPADNAAKAYLAEFLAAHDAMDQALEIWRQLPANGLEADALSYRDLAIHLLRELQSKNRFSEAKEVWTKFTSTERSPEDANNLITNPGFELPPLSEKYDALLDPPSGFDWIMLRHPEVRADRDSNASHSGAKALHLVFAASMNSTFQQISQLVSVDPSRQYRLSYFAKTQNISSLPSESPFIEITDAVNPTLFALRSVLPNAAPGWNAQTLTFTTPENTHGLRVKIHAPQLKTIDHTRIAELWLDDFSLSQYREQ
ncbi:MAG: tetratricopeptide repeat protein [Blastocatellia bacterium]